MLPLLRVFLQGGILMWPLVLIILVLCGIVIRALWHLYINDRTDMGAIQSCLDGLLFWGGFAVIIGVLGSVIGYHKAVSVVAARGLAHPKLLWLGTAEGMVTTIAGLLILAGAGACWFLLRSQYLKERTPAR